MVRTTESAMAPIQKQLHDLASRGKRTLFYPSARTDIRPALFNWDCELFIFADYGGNPHKNFTDWDYRWKRDADGNGIPDRRRVTKTADRKSRNERTKKHRLRKILKTHPSSKLLKETSSHFIFGFRNKLGIYFFEENNNVLARIIEAGLVLHYFVGLGDGCGEGGNWECVHSRRWLDRVLPLLAGNNGHYVFDHSEVIPKGDPEREFRYWIDELSDPGYLLSCSSYRKRKESRAFPEHGFSNFVVSRLEEDGELDGN